jgi:fumarate reductase flavoprotein subunit
MSGKLDRRSFLKGAGILGVTAAAAGALGACAPKDSNAGGNASGDGTSEGAGNEYVPKFMQRAAVGEPESAEQFDYVICGAGGCGMASLIQANDLGLKAVLLEKKDIAGGTFAFAAVSFAPNCPEAVADGKHVDINDIITSIQVYNHYIPSSLLIKNYLQEIPETIQWCEDLGCAFMYMGGMMPNYGTEVPFSMAVAYGDPNPDASAGMAFSEDGTAGGKFVAQQFIKVIEERGLDIRYNTPAMELVMENGKVAGVLAQDESGKIIKFEAPAVLLCTGGWGSNEDFLRELGKVNPERVISSGYDGRDGDGVYMARKVGTAWARGDGTVMFYGPHLPGSTWGDNLYNGVYQPVLWVDQNGNRFMNEGGANQMEVGAAIRDLPRMFVIQNQNEIDRLTTEGGFAEYNNGAGGGGELPKFKERLEAEIERGNERIFIADTLEELTAATGAVNLTATAERYNELAKAGTDEDFNKQASLMVALESGPYYAFECDDGFYTTVGGVRINENIQALDEEGKVIDGLFVAGCDTGALCGDIYDFTSAPGEQSSWALNSGRMVAKYVAANKG